MQIELITSKLLPNKCLLKTNNIEKLNEIESKYNFKT